MSDVIENIARDRADIDISSQRELRVLYDEYHGPLVSFFNRKLPIGEDPEDMTQQVFIKLMHAVKQTKFTFSKNLIFVIARNALIDRMRWRRSHYVDQHDMVDENIINSEAPLPDRILEGKQRLDIFFGHLDDLPLRCRQVFLLHRVYNLSQKQVAERLGISLSTVHKHMMNAMGKLQDNLQSAEE